MSFDFADSTTRRTSQQSMIARFFVDTLSRIIGNAVAIILASVLLFIGMHFYVQWRIEQITKFVRDDVNRELQQFEQQLKKMK